MNWPRPTTVTDVPSFLGFTNHYRRFIHKYAHIARPLNVLISGDNASKKKQAIKWNEDCEESFKKLKQLCSSTLFGLSLTTQSLSNCTLMHVAWD